MADFIAPLLATVLLSFMISCAVIDHFSAQTNLRPSVFEDALR